MGLIAIQKKMYDQGYKYGTLGYVIYKCISWYYYVRQYYGTEKQVLKRQHRYIFGKKLDFKAPQTLNEKIKWLKIYDRRKIHTVLADKFTMRTYMAERFGKEYLIPLLYETTDWRDITIDKIPDCDCIIKPSHSSGQYLIVREKEKLNIKKLRFLCRIWLGHNYYARSKEWQYKNSTRRIVIEKLLKTKDGHIPNDYKLHYINGKLAFVYCSVGRETVNKRNIYDMNWKPLYFSWAEKYKDPKNIRGEEIPAPPSFAKMKEIGAEIAKMFDYVRVDFYDVDGHLYCGEITFHHGGGNDVFCPDEYDRYYGQMLEFKNAKIE